MYFYRWLIFIMIETSIGRHNHDILRADPRSRVLILNHMDYHYTIKHNKTYDPPSSFLNENPAIAKKKSLVNIIILFSLVSHIMKFVRHRGWYLDNIKHIREGQ